jgi:hypothetical protein
MFDTDAYGPTIASILVSAAEDARDSIRRSGLPDQVRAGLFLHFGCWKEAHELAQNIETPDGSYWHAIVHRMEPDPDNAAYWFRRVGAHPIFPALRARAQELGYSSGAKWDPFAFIKFCERDSGPVSEAVQRAEWELLFDHCARQAKTGETGAS